MTVKQAATRLEISAANVYALVAGGKLRHYRVGEGRGCIRISDDHIVEYLSGAERMVEPPSAPVRKVRLKHLRPRSPA